MSKRDIETIIYDLFGYYESNLNTKISDISTEKGDGITLNTVDSSAFKMYPFDLQINFTNFDPIFAMSFTEAEPIAIKGDTSADLLLSAEVYTALNKNLSDDTVNKRLYRYARAVREVAEDAAMKLGYSNLTVQEVPPFGDFQITKSSDLFRGIGVLITVTYVG